MKFLSLVQFWGCVHINNLLRSCSILHWFHFGQSHTRAHVGFAADLHEISGSSVLNLILFLIYINDLHLSSDRLSFVLFADDTNVFLSGQNLDLMIHEANEE